MTKTHAKTGIVILAGLLLLSGVLLYAWKEIQLQQQTRTTASIVDYRTQRADNRYTHFPIIEFVVSEGRRIKHESSIGSSRRLGPIGSEVQIFFDPHNLQNITIDRFFQKHFVAAIIMFLGIGLLLISRIRADDPATLVTNSRKGQTQSMKAVDQLS